MWVRKEQRDLIAEALKRNVEVETKDARICVWLIRAPPHVVPKAFHKILPDPPNTEVDDYVNAHTLCVMAVLVSTWTINIASHRSTQSQMPQNGPKTRSPWSKMDVCLVKTATRAQLNSHLLHAVSLQGKSFKSSSYKRDDAFREGIQQII